MRRLLGRRVAHLAPPLLLLPVSPVAAGAEGRWHRGALAARPRPVLAPALMAAYASTTRTPTVPAAARATAVASTTAAVTAATTTATAATAALGTGVPADATTATTAMGTRSARPRRPDRTTGLGRPGGGQLRAADRPAAAPPPAAVAPLLGGSIESQRAVDALAAVEAYCALGDVVGATARLDALRPHFGGDLPTATWLSLMRAHIDGAPHTGAARGRRGAPADRRAAATRDSPADRVDDALAVLKTARREVLTNRTIGDRPTRRCARRPHRRTRAAPAQGCADAGRRRPRLRCMCDASVDESLYVCAMTALAAHRRYDEALRLVRDGAATGAEHAAATQQWTP